MFEICENTIFFAVQKNCRKRIKLKVQKKNRGVGKAKENTKIPSRRYL